MTGKVKTEQFSEEDRAKITFLGRQGAEYVMAGDIKYVIPKRLDIDFIKYKMPIFQDDIFIITPPKCGTTWTQEIVWLLLNNLEKPKKNQFYRIPFLEIQSIRPPPVPELEYPVEGTEQNEANLKQFQTHSIQYVQELKRPRIIKTHLPLSLLPDNLVERCKVIFVTRNIKDMAVSYYYHHRLASNSYEFKEFAEAYRRGIVLQTPMIPMVLEAWNQRSHPNLLFNTYEDMKKDFRSTIDRLVKFLNVTLPEDKFRDLEERVSIESFRGDVLVNKTNEIPSGTGTFIRKGVVGDWKNHFDDGMNKEWDAWIEEQMKDTDFKMVYEL